MHPRRLHREVMVTVLACGAPAERLGLHGRGAVARGGRRMVAAQLRQRLLRPAALAGRSRGGRGAVEVLLPKFARRQSKPMTEGPAEMRGIIKTVAEGNFRNRVMRLRRIGQLRRSPLQAALAQIMRKTASRTFEQLLQITLGYSFELRHPRRRQIGIIKLALDGL